jgi:hypothetical protein
VASFIDDPHRRPAIADDFAYIIRKIDAARKSRYSA